MPPSTRSAVIFDLGGVLIDWNPRHLYRKLFAGDEAGMEAFLATVCTQHWNEQQDAGRSFAEATALLAAEHPDQADLIGAYFARWAEMLGGAIEGTVEILDALRRRAVPVYALTNWSAETFPHATSRFDFLAWFKDIAVSGKIGIIKPDPRIYHLLLQRNGLAASDAVYVDDVKRNADAATALGLHGIHFTSPAALRRELEALGLL
jgi:2-haloacid dehalogenase